MRWLYLSPHFDDAAYSCGGLIWEQSHSENIPEILTVFSGAPESQSLTPFARALHERWQVPLDQAVERRHLEDQAALRCLGVKGQGLGIPECIYRLLPDGRALISREDDLWQEIPSDEYLLVDILGEVLALRITQDSNLVSPLGLGDHIDHRIVRAAAEKAAVQEPKIRLWYYPDFPYVFRGNNLALVKGREGNLFEVSDPAVSAWQQAIAAYASQLSTFWKSEVQMNAEVQYYRNELGGLKLFAGGGGNGVT